MTEQENGADPAAPAAAAPGVVAAKPTALSEQVQEAYENGVAAGRGSPHYEATVAKWVADCVHDTPIARDTEAYSYLVGTALPELVARLAAG